MNANYKTIIVKPSQAYGDLIETTCVLKSIHKALPNLEIKVKIAEGEKRQILEGYLKDYNGFVSELINLDYQHSQQELEIDLTWYQNELPNHYGFHYTEAMLKMAEKQLSENLNQEIALPRGIESKLIFPLEKFKRDIELGKRKLEEIIKEHPNKPIIWLGTRTAGSQNRMPQSYHPDFWTEIINNSSRNFIFYEKRGPNEATIHPKIYPKSGESLPLAAESEIIRASAAGIGIDGMQIHLAYALRNKKMIVLLGPTHPKAVIYPGSKSTMLTIPDLKTFENSKPCPDIGLHGYIQCLKYSEIKKIMKIYYPNFEFNPEIQKALEENSQDKLNKAIKNLKCPTSDCCFSQLTPQRVIEKLESLITQ